MSKVVLVALEEGEARRLAMACASLGSGGTVFTADALPSILAEYESAGDKVVAALQKEERVEETTVYQVAGDRVGWCGPVRIFPATEHLQAARDDLASFDHSDSAYTNIRILAQTTFTGPWTDLPLDEEGAG